MSKEKKTGTGRAMGKVILLGEHAVVHGMPALAVGLGVGIRAVAGEAAGPVTLWMRGRADGIVAGGGTREGDAVAALLQGLGLPTTGARIDVEIDLPIRAGLGSSAALAASMARALIALFEIERTPAELYEAVQASERVFHGNPSGLDATLALQGGILVFTRGQGARTIEAARPPLLAVHSGEPGDTKATVARFAARLTETGEVGKGRLLAIKALVEEGIGALERGDLQALGRVMNGNHAQLKWFGVSSAGLDRITELALGAGALGAKLTGGGGGGCAVVLTESGDRVVSATLKEAGYEVVGL